MANLRTGKYGGQYYGSYYNESVSLTDSEMKVNARYLYEVLHFVHGWTMEAVSGLLGNAQHESAINPGRWQSDKVGNTSSGYGLTQWTPASKYINWCSDMGYDDPSEMDNNIARIMHEVNNGGQYYATPNYPESFKQFVKSTKDPYYLACAFAFNYERSWVALYGSAEEKEALRQKRGGSANFWYDYLSNYYSGTVDPDNPELPDEPEPEQPDPPIKTKRMSLLMMYIATKR